MYVCVRACVFADACVCVSARVCVYAYISLCERNSYCCYFAVGVVVCFMVSDDGIVISVVFRSSEYLFE